MLHKPFAMAALLVASCGAQAASDADLAAIRSQIDEMKKSYEQRIAALEQKLAQAEAAGKSNAPVAAPVSASASGAAAPSDSGQRTTLASSAAAFNPEVSLILQGQYAQMKNVPDRTITGFWPAGGHDHDGGKGVTTRGFSLNHTELVFSGGIDPYWRGQAIFAVLDESVEVEEAWFQSLAIGHGVGMDRFGARHQIGFVPDKRVNRGGIQGLGLKVRNARVLLCHFLFGGGGFFFGLLFSLGCIGLRVCKLFRQLFNSGCACVGRCDLQAIHHESAQIVGHFALHFVGYR